MAGKKQNALVSSTKVLPPKANVDAVTSLLQTLRLKPTEDVLAKQILMFEKEAWEGSESVKQSQLISTNGGKRAGLQRSEINQNTKSDAVHPFAGFNFGHQPNSIEMEQETIQEMQMHSLVGMLTSLRLSAKTQQRKKKAGSAEKDTDDMTEQELVDMRNRAKERWDNLAKRNAIIDFALTKPTFHDLQRAEKARATRQPQKLLFDQEVECTVVPAGKDFQRNEVRKRLKAKIKKK